MTPNLRQALIEQKQQTEQYNQPIYGILGIPLGGQRLVEVPNRNGYVYVRLRNNQSETIQAFNNKVSPAYNLPVIVERQGGRYAVVSVDTERYENNWNSFAPFLPRHGNTHSFDIESGGGGDIVWVYPRQFIPAMVMPSGSLGAGNVFVNSYTLKKDDNTWLYTGNTGTPSLLTYRPSSPTGAVMALVYLDTNTGNPGIIINSGTVFSNAITGSSQIAPYIPSISNPSTQAPLAAIRLITGTNAISWDNIYDVRQFVHNTPTGTGGGSASINTGTLNSLYLRLDASNDPVTGPLAVISNNAANVSVNDALFGILNGDTNSSRSALYGASISGGYGGTISAKNNNVLILNQEFDGGYETPDDDKAGMYASRFQSDSLPRSISKSPFLIIDDFDEDMDYYGGTLRHIDPYGSDILHLNPQATGSAIPYRFNTQYYKPPGTVHSEWLVSGTQIAYLDVSGTFHSNGSPLIKEAPVDGNQYARKNAGWDVVSSSSSGDWNNFPGTLEWKGSDSPTFNADATGNVTGTIAVGAKVKLTHYTPKFFVVTSIGTPSGTVTPLTLYGGTDYALAASGTISSPQYSHSKSPIGFPLNREKWTVEVTDTSARTQATPTQNQWYNLGSISIDVPIGMWDVEYNVLLEVDNAATDRVAAQATLSTANNSESDADFTSMVRMFGATAYLDFIGTIYRHKPLTLSSKTTYYINTRTTMAGIDTIYNSNNSSKLILRAVCILI